MQLEREALLTGHAAIAFKLFLECTLRIHVVLGNIRHTTGRVEHMQAFWADKCSRQTGPRGVEIPGRILAMARVMLFTRVNAR